MIRVLLVDDHEIVRTGLKLLLQDTTNIEVVAEASNGEEAIRLAKQVKPDVILMDVNMPGIGGFEATLRLLRNEPNSRILIISSQTDDVIPARLMNVGASGYISKKADNKEMINAIFTVAEGKRYFDAAMADQLVIQNIAPKSKSSHLFNLTDREFQILLMVARGISVDEMAKKLFLSNKTVNGYRGTIFKKLGVKTDVEATRFAIAHGLIDVDSQWH